jgi:hypothetical protein
VRGVLHDIRVDAANTPQSFNRSLPYAINLSKLIPIMVVLISVIGVSMMLIIPTTTILVSGLREGEQCTVFLADLFPDSTGERCCPAGHVWKTEHAGAGTYWDCEPGAARAVGEEEAAAPLEEEEQQQTEEEQPYGESGSEEENANN